MKFYLCAKNQSKKMKIFLFVLLFACFAIVVTEAAVKKSGSNLPTKKVAPTAAKKAPTRHVSGAPKKQVKSVSSKSQGIIANLIQDTCTQQFSDCGACFGEGNGTCYWDTAAEQCRTISLVLSNNYCPSSSASSVAVSSIVFVASIIAVFVI